MSSYGWLNQERKVMRTLVLTCVFMITCVHSISAKSIKDNDLRNDIISKGDVIAEWKEGGYIFKSFYFKKSVYVCAFGLNDNQSLALCFDEKGNR